jgi:hypothetical protein
MSRPGDKLPGFSKTGSFEEEEAASVLRGFRERREEDGLTRGERTAAEALANLSTVRREELIDLTIEMDDAFDAADEVIRGGKGRKRGRGRGAKPEAAEAAIVVSKAGGGDEVGSGPDAESKVKEKIRSAIESNAASSDKAKAEVAKVIASNPSIISKLVARAVSYKPHVITAATVGAVVVAANRPTFYGNLVRVFGSALRSLLQTSITATWGDWGQLAKDIGTELGLFAGEIGRQTAMGPVVPFAIATAWVAYTASKKGTTMSGLLSEYASSIRDAATSAVASQLTAAKEAYKTEASKAGLASLRSAVEQVRASVGPSGEGAAAMKAAVASLGVPAMTEGSVVRARPSPALKGPIDKLAAAPADLIFRNTEERKAMAGAIALVDLANADDLTQSITVAPDAAAAPAVPAVPDAPMDAGRRRRRTKRRAPKRKRITRKMPIFVY